MKIKMKNKNEIYTVLTEFARLAITIAFALAVSMCVVNVFNLSDKYIGYGVVFNFLLMMIGNRYYYIRQLDMKSKKKNDKSITTDNGYDDWSI